MRLGLENPLRLPAGDSAHPRAEIEFMLRAMGFLFLAGASLGTAWLLLPHPEAANERGIELMILLSTAFGALTVGSTRRLPAWAPGVGDVAGTAMIGLAVYWGGEASTVFSVMLVWIAAYNAYFFRPLTAGLLLAGVGLVYALALGLHPEPEAGWISRWLVTMAALSVTSALIAWLVKSRGAAEQERLHLAALVAESDEAIVGESLGGLVLSWNRGAEALYGYAAEEMVGEPIERLLPPGYEDDSELLDRLRLGERVLDHETVRLRKDGSLVAVSLTISPVHDAAGAIVGASTVARDISRHKELELKREEMLAESRRQALTDPLTGLANRRSWDRELRQALSRASHDGRPVCVALIDLDHFKRYNDRHGHLAGDQLLREAAETWKGLLREDDLIARYGGEEFAILLPDCQASDAEVIVERLRRSTPLAESSSAGVTDWCPGDSVDDVIARADAALYRAKRQGRDRLVKVSSPSSSAA
jgi:diguanylate cyclase (GGDEF)-like protein/PAS domain S-box-containing protein